MDLLLIIALYCFGIWAILHTAKAVRTGIYHGWYNGTFEDYYIHKDDSPFRFWFETLFMALTGSWFIGFTTLLVNEMYKVF